MNYLQYDFTIKDIAQAEQLIALLSHINFEGFEEEENTVKAFIAEELFAEADFRAVLDLFSSLIYHKKIVENINWNAKWESDFKPVLISDFVAIRAGFHLPIKNVQHQIIITPKMSFGTGHHATTFLMMQQMATINFTNKRVLDFGTGTGVLAILAQKLGAAQITALDNDDWSIENAKENIETNAAQNIVIEKTDTISKCNEYDIILANINLNVILQNMPAIAKACKPYAVILLSGFLKTDENKMLQSLNENGFSFNALTQQKDWICIKANRP